MTTTITWPVTVPWAALSEGYSETLQRNVSSFQPDAGVAIERRRASTSLVELSFTLLPMDGDALDDLNTFFSDTTKSGVLPFNTTHPRTENSIVAKFMAAPQIANVMGSYYRVSVHLMVLS